MQRISFRSLAAFIFSFCYLHGFSQDTLHWAKLMQDPHGNYYTIKEAFEKHWLTHDKNVKGNGYKRFRRWEDYVAPRVYPSGDLSLLGLTPKNFQEFLEQQPKQKGAQPPSTAWTPLGPMGTQYPGGIQAELNAGRINFITIDPTNTLNLWVGAPSGGLWRSTNGGASWSTNTDFLPVTGCSDLAIDPTNTNVMYLATGDHAGDDPSIGVLKSTDGGQTWNVTGLTAPVSTNFVMNRLLINPFNTQIVLAATDNGIYRTTNGGTTWTQITTSFCSDLEFKPGDPNTVYATGNDMKLSTNGGASFTQVTASIVNNVLRMVVAVTPADPTYVYALATNGSGFVGLYRSVNSGASFAVMSTTPNIIGINGGYDLCIAVSPLNKDEVVTGGLNLYRSTDGGATWALYNQYAPTLVIHVDNHELEYAPDGTLFNGNDGSLYKRLPNAAVWTQISGSMNISQIYRMGLSALTANKWISGHQDNGTSIWDGTTYTKKLGGDGMDCFFDRTNDNNIFGQAQYGALFRTQNGGVSWTNIVAGLSGAAGWISPWAQDPVSPNTLYVAYTDLFKSTNLGTTWTSLAPIPAPWQIRGFEVAPSNNQVIYVIKPNAVFKTTNGGASWINVTGTIPFANCVPQDICVSPTDPDKAWVTLSAFSTGNKVFMTTNGGATWINYSSNLPNISAQTCVYEPGSNDRIYVGMDVGVYYRDNSSPVWTLYNNALPNVRIADLKITPASPGLLYAATYGRGIWSTSLISTLIPSSKFSMPGTPVCTGTPFTFNDQSTESPTNWTWSVTPASNATITSAASQNPMIHFAAPGIYTISLQAGNGYGQGTALSKTISVIASPNLSVTPGQTTICNGKSISFSVSGASTYSWSHGGGSSSTASYTPPGSMQYTVTGTSNGCTSTAIVNVTVLPCAVSGFALPTSPLCTGATYTFTDQSTGAPSSWNWSVAPVNGVIVNSANSQNPGISFTGPGIYTVSLLASNTNGSSSAASQTIAVSATPDLSITPSHTMICHGESVTFEASGAAAYSWSEGGGNSSIASYTPQASAQYTVTGTSNGCTASAAIELTVSTCAGISTLLLNHIEFALFPNPARDKLSIRSNLLVKEEIGISICDAAGKLVFTQQLRFAPSQQVAEVNLEQLAQGAYFITLSTEHERSKAMRIFKE